MSKIELEFKTSADKEEMQDTLKVFKALCVELAEQYKEADKEFDFEVELKKLENEQR